MKYSALVSQVSRRLRPAGFLQGVRILIINLKTFVLSSYRLPIFANTFSTTFESSDFKSTDLAVVVRLFFIGSVQLQVELIDFFKIAVFL